MRKTPQSHLLLLDSVCLEEGRLLGVWAVTVAEAQLSARRRRNTVWKEDHCKPDERKCSSNDGFAS